MNEVDKLYENAEILKVKPSICANNEKFCENCVAYDKGYIPCCRNAEYPPFTAEKQLQLENFLLEDSEDKTFTQFEMLKTIENKFLYVYRFSKNNSNLKRFDALGETRKESLARLINNLWQGLTDAEKQQIKNILESEVRE